jgi:hypothetical protein
MQNNERKKEIREKPKRHQPSTLEMRVRSKIDWIGSSVCVCEIHTHLVFAKKKEKTITYTHSPGTCEVWKTKKLGGFPNECTTYLKKLKEFYLFSSDFSTTNRRMTFPLFYIVVFPLVLCLLCDNYRNVCILHTQTLGKCN